MARIYRDEDADLTVLDGKTVAVLGYGNQGRSQALNLADSGVHVVVGNRGDDYRQVAREDGFDAHDLAAATAKGDVVLIMLPDEVHHEVLPVEVFPHLRAGAALVFGHGYSIHFGEVDPPAGSDVVMVAPKMLGPSVRRLFELGQGFPTLVAVHRDETGQAWPTALAVAKGIGSTRLGAWESSFEEETITDLFGEQVGGSAALVGFHQSFTTLVEAGYDPEVVQLELLGSGELIEVVRTQALRGMVDSLTAHSPTSQFGQLYRAKTMLDSQTRDGQREVLKDLQDGNFAKTWRSVRSNDYEEMESLRGEFLDLPFVEVEQRNRERLRKAIEAGES